MPDTIPPGWENDFLFTAGSIRAARRLEDIILALYLLKEQGIVKRLIIAGGIDPYTRAYKTKIDKLAERRGVKDQILWTGQLPAEKMSWCYRNSSAFIMTSRVEACPNIVLEAMAHGCVSISTDAMPMPEFFVNAALYYSQSRPETLAEKIREASAMDEEKESVMRTAALARAAEFTWEKCAERTAAFLSATTKAALKK